MIRIETRKRKAPEIGMAPLVDCVLLLLIFFLLTSSFSTQRAMKIQLPSSTTADRADKHVLTIMISDTGALRFGGQSLTPVELTSALLATVSNDGKKPVILVAHRMVPLERVTETIDCIRTAGLETVSIATTVQADGASGDE